MPETSFEKKINEIYNRALKNGGLLYFENTVINKVENDIEFQIRLAPSLAKKPTDNIGKKEIIVNPNNANEPKVDPFAPYDQQLFVEEYEKYIILLNKYCIIPKHLLVVTKEYESQANPLNPNDFDALWHCMKQIKSQKSLAFYNCGELSGASQSHKHMQILTLSDEPPMSSPICTIQDKKPGEIFELAELPFIHYLSFIDPQKLCDNESSDDKSSDDKSSDDKSSDDKSSDGEPGQYLNKLFHSMLSILIESLHNQLLSSEGGEEEEEEKKGKSSFRTLSYNFIMTQKWMMIVPRCNSTHELQIDINSLGFAGMLLAKSEDELECIKGVGVMKFLKEVAIPKKNL
ncbi:hypothetical protein Glove_158g54 [Diversispora epigaea]|uniref:Uncharacterized protein n=1 Tax=Diversispora epigaea TaxID=1348612 RepID=A0A397IRL9_9GLOM|nr:hypothetical protein Glove_158g54 [Diversispora epigaea]